MHAKTLIFDGRSVLTGSVNMTHNGFENNKEHMIQIYDPETVACFVQDFEDSWAIAEEVTPEKLTAAAGRPRGKGKGRGGAAREQSAERVTREKEEAPRKSRSLSRDRERPSRTVRRSLSTELQVAQSDERGTIGKGKERGVGVAGAQSGTGRRVADDRELAA